MKSDNLRFKQQLTWVGAVGAAVLLIEIINLVTGRALNQFSIYPREFQSIGFIFTSPLLHANFQHFLSNFLTLCIFSFLMLEFGKRAYISATLFIVIVSGILVWLFGRTAFHLGASGVVYGYFGYLLLAGFLSKKLHLLAISIVVVIFYGGLIWGVLPGQPMVSWEAHLFGFGAGATLAYIKFKNRQK